MSNNKQNGISFNDILILFRSTINPERDAKNKLLAIGMLLTPITLLGAIWGYIRSYNRFSRAGGEAPAVSMARPIHIVAMIMGGIFIWALIFAIVYFVTPIVMDFFNNGGGSSHTVAITIGVNILLAYLVMSEFRSWQNSVSNELAEKGKFGTARFAEKHEIEDLNRKRGLYIGGETFAYPKSGHLISISGTRLGKGTGLIIPNLLGLGGMKASYFILDIKGENAAISARVRREMGNDVFILDPWNESGMADTTFNPLDLVLNQKNPDYIVDDISVLAEMIVPRENKGEQYWNNKARSLITGLLLHIILSQAEEKKNLITLWEWLRLPEEDFEKLIVDMGVSKNNIVQASANEILLSLKNNPKMLGDIMSTAQDKTAFLQSPALQKNMVKSSLDINQITNGKTSLYVIFPPDKIDSHYQWLRLVTVSAMRSVIRNKNKRVVFLLDEFACLQYFPEALVALSTYAGYNLTLWPILQDLSQLQRIYGDAWQSFIGNTAVRHFSVSDNFSTEYLSTMAGETTVIVYDKEGRSHATARKLLTPDEVRRGSADHFFCMIENRPITYFQKKAYFDMPFMKGRYDANPYYRPDTENDEDNIDKPVIQNTPSLSPNGYQYTPKA